MERTKIPTHRNGSKGDSNLDSLDFESGILQMSYRIPFRIEEARTARVFSSKKMHMPLYHGCISFNDCYYYILIGKHLHTFN